MRQKNILRSHWLKIRNKGTKKLLIMLLTQAMDLNQLQNWQKSSINLIMLSQKKKKGLGQSIKRKGRQELRL